MLTAARHQAVLALSFRRGAFEFPAAVRAGGAQFEDTSPCHGPLVLEVADAVVSLTATGKRISDFHGCLAWAPVVGFGARELRRGLDMARRNGWSERLRAFLT